MNGKVNFKTLNQKVKRKVKLTLTTLPIDLRNKFDIVFIISHREHE